MEMLALLVYVHNFSLSLVNCIFIIQWAFGVTCWEIFALGLQPYPSISAWEVADYIKDGGILKKPFLCSDQM